MNYLATIRKALLAAGFTAVGTLGGLMADGNLIGADIIVALGAGMAAGTVTWTVPNE